MRLRTLGLITIFIVAGTGVAHAQDTTLVTVVNNTGADGSSAPAGTMGTLWGQTFTAPAAVTFLSGFSFWTDGASVASMVARQLWAMSPSAILGPLLWSDTIPHPGPLTRSDMDFPGVTVSPGDFFAFFVGGIDAPVAMQLYGGGYAGGDVHFYSPPSTTALAFFAGPDMRFEARFGYVTEQVVPEPATVILLATGLLGIGGVTLVRGRRQSV